MSYRDELDALFTEIRAAALDEIWREWNEALAAASNRGPYDPPVPPAENPAVVEHDFNYWWNTNVAPWKDTFGTGDRETFQVLINALDDQIEVDSIGPYTPDYVAYPGTWGNIMAARETVTVTVADALATWNGLAADTFRRAFLGNFGTAADNQLGMVQGLGRVLRAYQRVLSQGQDAVLEIGRAAVNALNELGESDFSTRQFTFLLVNAVASIAGAPAAVGVAISTVDFVTGLGGGGEQPEVTGSVQGGTAYEVLVSLCTELFNLTDQIAAEENLIAGALTAAQGSLGRDLGEYLATDDYLGWHLSEFDLDTSTVAADAAALYHAGFVDMSAAAYNYDHAVRRLDLCATSESEAFGSWFSTTVGDYQALRASFCTDVLGATRDNLVTYGNSLCEASVLYAETDGATAAQVRSEFEAGLDALEASGEGLPDTLNDPPVHRSRGLGLTLS